MIKKDVKKLRDIVKGFEVKLGVKGIIIALVVVGVVLAVLH